MAINITQSGILTNQVNTLTSGYFTELQLELITAIAILIIFLILAKLSDIVFEQVFKKLTQKTKTEIDDKIINVLMTPIFLTVTLFGVIIALSTIMVLENTMVFLTKIAKTVLIIIWTITAAKISTIIIYDILGKVTKKTKSTLDNEMLPLFQNLAKIIIYFLGLTMILSAWQIDLTPFLATAGVAGIAIAFAAQNTISHIFGGISVYFDKPFKVGDRIQLESGEYGDVTEIGIRSTRILTLDETMIVIPNDKIANSKIVNYHAPYSRMKVKMRIGVVYGSDVGKVKKTLLKVAKNAPHVLKNPTPVVLFVEHGDFSLQFLLITWVENPMLKGDVTDELNVGIDREFRKEKIEIAFPTQTIYTIKGK
ncbi:MAG: mechanosensitive ion channel family protein [archaeon]